MTEPAPAPRAFVSNGVKLPALTITLSSCHTASSNVVWTRNQHGTLDTTCGVNGHPRTSVALRRTPRRAVRTPSPVSRPLQPLRAERGRGRPSTLPWHTGNPIHGAPPQPASGQDTELALYTLSKTVPVIRGLLLHGRT